MASDLTANFTGISRLLGTQNTTAKYVTKLLKPEVSKTDNFIPDSDKFNSINYGLKNNIPVSIPQSNTIFNNGIPNNSKYTTNVSPINKYAKEQLTPSDDPMRIIPDTPAPPAKKKSFFEVLADIFLAIFRVIFGLFGIGLSGSAGAKLTDMEKINGRPISKTPANNPDTGEFGPYPMKKITIDIPTSDGKTTPADVYIPQGKGPFPAVIHCYGLASNKENHAGTASHYASWGMVVIVPKLPHGGDSPSENYKDLETWVNWVKSRPASLPNNLWLERGVGLSGHSFGGLTSVLAGSQPGVGCIVALDPADAFGKGKEMASQITAPSAFIVGEPSFANQMGNGVDIYDAAGGNKELIKVKGAQHMDFENSKTDGAKNASNKTAMRFAVGFMLYNLAGLDEYKAYSNSGSEVKAETGDLITAGR